MRLPDVATVQLWMLRHCSGSSTITLRRGAAVGFPELSFLDCSYDMKIKSAVLRQMQQWQEGVCKLISKLISEGKRDGARTSHRSRPSGEELSVAF